MKKTALISVLMFLLLASCASKMFQPTDVGKSFGVIVPDEVPIFREPSLKAEKFYLKEAEAFVVEQAVCEGGGGWWKECVLIIMDMPHMGFLKARFESGEVGYINFSFFFPDYSKYIMTEEVAAMDGITPEEYIVNVRKSMKEVEMEYMDSRKMRRGTIMAKPWAEDIKQLVMEGRLKVGMTKEQVMLSHTPPDMEPFKPLRKVSESVTTEGRKEKWVCNDITYEFENDKLVGWQSLGRSMRGDQLIESCK